MLLAVAVAGAACSDNSSSTTCVPLAQVAAMCPADWSAVPEAMSAFCAKEAPFFDAFRSAGLCRGRLHYTRYLFDGGPRYCVYDTTLKLVGYGAFDGKAMFEQWTCGVKKEDFDDKDCPGMTCLPPDAGAGGD